MKKQFRKGMSLFLSILMLLSCWVWIAPNEANAISSGSYYWRVICDSSNNTGGWDNAQWNVYGKPNNGRGSESLIHNFGYRINFNENGRELASGSSTMFPTKVTFDYSFGGGITHRKMDAWFYLEVSGDGSNYTRIGSCQAYSYEWGTNKGTKTLTVGSDSYPYAKSVVTATAPNSQTVPRTGTASTTAAFYCNDQYGVRLAANVDANNGWKGCTATGASTGASGLSVTGPTNTATSSGDNSVYTVNITNAAKIAGNTNSQTVTITPKFKFNGKEVTGSATFTLSDPDYIFYINPNGGEVYHNSTWYNNQQQYTRKYGAPIGASAVPSQGRREGYEFIGMYSPKKDDNYDYTKPVAGSGSYSGQLTSTTQVNADTNWYAAWWAKNIEVEFRTDDNQLIGKYTSKYNQKESHGTEATNALTAKGYDIVKGGSFDGKFSGWIVREAYDINGNDRNLGGASIADITLQGKTVFVPEYTYGKNSYEVKFIGPNGNTLNSQTTYQYRDDVETPADQEKTTDARYIYNFKGWAVRSEGQRDTSYLVDSNGFTENGEAIAIVNDFTVRNDVTYIAVFEKVYREYTVKYVEKNKTTTFDKVHYGDEITAPEAENNFVKDDRRWHFTGWKLESGSEVVNGTCRGDATYTAEYYDEEVEYQIRFFDHTSEATGQPINRVTSYKAGAQVTVPTNILRVYRDDSFEYTFIGWDRNPSTVANADRDYYAIYESSPLYTVNYYNGDELIEGASVKEPAGTNIANKYVGETPTKADDKYATNYVFKGWADAEGNVVTTLGEGNLDLYAQYDCDVIDYTVEFKNDDGSTISSNTYKYLDEIVVPENPTKADDDTYTYEFRSWDIDVNPLCEDSVVYTATYRRTYKYYTVEWLDENNTVVNTQKYIYNERINPPVAPETSKVSTDPNFTYVFDAWENVATGEKFSRGERISGNAQYKATYKLEANICTVELYDDDGTTLLQTIKVPYGTTDILSVSSTPIKKSNNAVHYNFTGWKNFDGTNFTSVNGDLKLKASYDSAAHKFVPYDVEVAPTFFENGKGIEICENENCKLTRETVISKLEDTLAPTAKLYVKNHTWESTKPESADFENAIPVAPSNMLIVNTADYAMRSLYNPLGVGSGIKTIEYSIQSGKTEPSSISNWSLQYDYDQMEDARKDKESNVTGRLEDLNLKDGQVFVIYARIIDRCGNAAYVNSGLLVYDAIAPEVTVTSDHQNSNKHCINATINVEQADDIESVTLNGEALELTDGKALVEKAGLYQVAVVDKAGNTTRVTFEIIGTHSSQTYTTSATCEEDGFVREVCTLCNAVLSEKMTDKLGHDWSESVYTAPTCHANGFTTTRCKRCGETVIEYDDPDSTIKEHALVENVLLRKDPTCTKTGIKVSECSICHDTIIEEIPVDSDAHIFYRDKQTTDPTCLEKGEVTHECKYCGKVLHVRDVEALGHDDGEWKETKAPTCTAAGEKELHCTRCDVLLDTQPVEALGHSYKAVVTAPTETSQGFTTYTCVRCGDSYVDDYTDPTVRYTITFVDEAGKTVKEFKLLQGETITAADVPAQSKDANDTYKYTFEGWVDADGKAVAFPITAEKSMKLSPKFSSSYVSYTVTLYKEGGKEQYNNKIGYLHNDKTPAYVLPTTGPDKASDSTYDYKFIGWSTDGTKENIVKEVAKFTEDLSFVAVYEPVLREYNVVFAYDADNVIKVYKNVEAGTDATNMYDGAEPTKAHDAINHYKFAGWSAFNSADLKNIQSNTLVLAQFTAVEHDYDTQVVQEQTKVCLDEEITKFTCKDCGYSYEAVTKAKGDHVWGAPVEGKVTCTICGEIKEDETTYTVTFLDEDGKTVIKTIDFIKYGDDISSRVPTPTKAADNNFFYEFAGWDKNVETTVTDNATYTATYNKIERRYKVIFAYNSQNIIKIYENQPLMDDFTVIYDQAVPTKTDKDDYGHYVFAGWSNRGINEELKSVYLEAQFRKVDHNYTSKQTPATCEVGAGTTYTCTDCGYSYTKATGAPLGHKWVVTKTVEPTYTTEGYVEYTCTVCKQTKRDPLSAVPSIIARIYVNDRDGHPIEGVKVTLVDAITGAFIGSNTTGSDGYAYIRVPSATTYTVLLEGQDMENYVGSITVDANGTTHPDWEGKGIEVIHCTCTCHKDGAWASIFRFFHKIIKLFAGKYKCCNNPDPRYGK